MADLTIAAGDLHPALAVTLYDRNMFPPCSVDLTDATGVDVMWVGVDTTVPTTRAAEIVAPRLDGLVRYQWVAGDTAVPGRRWVAFVVHFPDGDATYSGYEVDVAAALPAASPVALAALRRLVGTVSPPTDGDLARALADAGSVNAAGLHILRARLTDMLASPLKRTDPEGIDYDYNGNVKWLSAMITDLENADSDDDGIPDQGGRRMRAYSLTRADGYR